MGDYIKLLLVNITVFSLSWQVLPSPRSHPTLAPFLHNKRFQDDLLKFFPNTSNVRLCLEGLSKWQQVLKHQHQEQVQNRQQKVPQQHQQQRSHKKKMLSNIIIFRFPKSKKTIWSYNYLIVNVTFGETIFVLFKG